MLSLSLSGAGRRQLTFSPAFAARSFYRNVLKERAGSPVLSFRIRKAQALLIG
jgi:hypothetical protein